MSEPLTPYEKAGRVFRLFAWIQIVAVAGILAAVIIPMFAQQKAPPAASLLVLLVLLLPLLYFKVGRAIKEHKDWGRTAGILLGILMLFGFPIGTLIGAYILWCLIKGWDQQPA
jgi:hypothetical protein